MKRVSLITLLLLGSLSLFSQKIEKSRELTSTEKIVGLSRLWEGVKNNFVYYDQLKFSWDSLYAASIPRVLETKDTYSYVRELERIAAKVKDGHTYIIHNVGPRSEDRITPAPFTTRLIEGKVFVDKVWSTELLKREVKRGVEVTAIDGIGVIKYGEESIGEYVSSSTPQWLEHQIFNQYELTKGRRSVHVNVEFLDGKRRFAIDIDRDSRWDIQEKEASVNDEHASISYTTLKGNVGLLTIRDFMNNSFIQIFDSLYPRILQSKALVIDLRDNGGGRSNYADYVLTHLSSKPIKTSTWSSRMYIPAHASWGYPAEWFSNPSEYLDPVSQKTIYDKPIVVLTSAGTFSSSEDFCVKFRGMQRGKLIGTATGGSTGNGVRITLVSGIASVNICSKKDIAPDGTVFVGVGVIPDVEVNETKQSFLSRKDIVLDRAIQELQVSK